MKHLKKILGSLLIYATKLKKKKFEYKNSWKGLLDWNVPAL